MTVQFQRNNTKNNVENFASISRLTAKNRRDILFSFVVN